jgi:hypothetical protein
MRPGSNTIYELHPIFDNLRDYITLYLPFGGLLPPQTRYDLNTLAKNGLAPATESGAVTGRDGRFADRKGLVVSYGNDADGRGNHVENPSAETNSTYWNHGGVAGNTFARSYGAARFGNYSIYVTCDGTVANQGCRVGGTAVGGYIPGIVAGNDYCISFWILPSVSQTTTEVRVVWYTAAGAYNGQVGATQAVTGGVWQRVIQVATAPANTASALVFFRKTNSGAAWTFYADCVQVERRNYPSAYCDGSMGAGHVWVGVAHASQSTRTVGTLEYLGSSVWPTGQVGSFGYWFYVHGQGQSTRSFGTVFNVPFAPAGVVRNPLDEGGTPYRPYTYFTDTAAVTFSTLGSGLDLTRGWHHYICTWNYAGYLRNYVNGVRVGAQPSMVSGSWGVTPSGNAYIGTSSGGSVSNANISEFILLNKELTAAEVLAIYNATLSAHSGLHLRECAYCGDEAVPGAIL